MMVPPTGWFLCRLAIVFASRESDFDSPHVSRRAQRRGPEGGRHRPGPTVPRRPPVRPVGTVRADRRTSPDVTFLSCKLPASAFRCTVYPVLREFAVRVSKKIEIRNR